MSISEANYINGSGIKITEYSIEYTDMGVGYGTSRQVLLIHNSIQYTRRKDLEDKYLWIIVCKIKVNRNTHFNMIAHYRQWQLPQELKSNANQYNSQEYRYSKTIVIFSSILEDNSHSIFIGDDNIDTLNNHNFHHNSSNIFLKNIRDEFLVSKKNNST